MPEEVGIVMKLYDQVSPSLKSIAGNTKAFDKDMDDLEASLKAYDKAQTVLTDRLASLKKEMAENSLKVKEAQKAYKSLKDETSKGALDDAIEEQVRLRREMAETTAVINSNAAAYKNLYREASTAASTESRLSNRADAGGGILSALGKAGLMDMAGDAAGQWVDAIIGSTFGGTAGSVVSSGLSGAVQGAAMGSLLGLPGMAVGAAIGGGLGLVTGGSQAFQERDETFKQYVQEATQGQLEEMQQGITSGSAVAAGRELDLIAFDQLLGPGMGARYLEDLREMAASTPMEYSDLTAMSWALATGFGDDTDRMLALMRGIGDAGSAVGVSAQDMTVMAQALSRMESSNKASLEYLNMFQERGVDVIGMLAESLGVDQGKIYDMISKGSISGTQAVDIIQSGLGDYAGAMDQMSKTFSGLESTLADARTEMDNAYGEGYNETRKQGLQDEIDYLSGESGAMIQEANRAMGAWQAELENSKEQFQREALDAVMSGAETTLFSDEAQKRLNELTNEYQKAQAEGDAAEMGRALAEARVMGLNEYNASEGAQLMLDMEMAMAEQIREDASTNSAYWDAGYRKGQEYSKGMMAAIADRGVESFAPGEDTPGGRIRAINAHRYAVGLDRVPYDDFPAMLHEGERVLTAREAEQADRKRGARFQITITGNSFGSGATAEEIAQRLADQIELKMAAGVYG